MITRREIRAIQAKGCMSGAEFRALRKRLELSQTALGEILGLSSQTIARYENGKADNILAKKVLILLALEASKEEGCPLMWELNNKLLRFNCAASKKEI